MAVILCGPPGSGKTTVAKMFEQKLGYKRFYAGALFRKEALKRNMTLIEFLKECDKDPSFDKWVDEQIVQLAKQHKDSVIESRVGIYFLPNELNVYVDVNPEVGVQRLFSDMHNRPEQGAKTLEDFKKETIKRVAEEKERYQKLYGIDMTDKSKFTLVIDSSDKTPEEVFNEICSFIKEHK